MKECCGFMISLFLAFYPLFTTAKMSDEAFSELRTQISTASRKSPLAGIVKVDELMVHHSLSLVPAQRIRLLYLKSWYQINADRIKEAMNTLAQARLLAREIEEPGILYSYYSISASAFSNVELYELALENNLKAYEEAPLLKSTEFIHQTENNIGHIYLKLGLLDEAQNYFQRFYESALALNQPSQQSTGLNNLGEAAFLKGELDKALDLHTQALVIRQTHGYEYHESWSLYNLGRVYIKREDYQQGEKYLTQAIDNWRKQNAVSKTIQPKLELAKAYIQQQRTDEAINMLKEVVDIGYQYQQFSALQEALMLQSKLTRKEGLLADALIALDKYNLVAKKFTQKQASIGLAYMVSQTELQTKETALKQLEQQHQLTLSMARAQQQRDFILLISAVIIILISSFFLYRLNKRKHQLQTLVEQLEATQDKLIESEKMRAMTTLVSGMAHQLNTPLGLVITANSTLQAQVNTLTTQFSEQTLTQKKLADFIGGSTELLALSQNNTEKAADLIQRFKMMSSKLQISELSTFTLVPFLEDNIASLVKIHKHAFSSHVNGADIEITNYKSVLLKVITQLVENSVKHGFGNTVTPRIDVQIVHIDDNKVVIHYKDNGSGIPKTKHKQVFDPFYTTRLGEGSLGLGLNIIYNSVVHIMKGDVECTDDSEGAHFVISIPVNVQRTSLVDSSDSAQL